MKNSVLYSVLVLLSIIILPCLCSTSAIEEFVFNDCKDSPTCVGLTSSACQYPAVVSDCPILCNSSCDITDWESNALEEPPCVPMKKLVNLHLPEVKGYSYSVTHAVISRCIGLHETMACVTDNTTTMHGSVTSYSHEGKHKENIKVTYTLHHSCHYEKSKCKKKYLQEEEECYELEESHYWNEASCKCECYVHHVLNDCVLDRIVNHYQHTSAVYYVPIMAFVFGLVMAIILMYLWQQNQNTLQEKYNALNRIRTITVHCDKHSTPGEKASENKDEDGNEVKKTSSNSDIENKTSVEDGNQGSPESLPMRRLSDSEKNKTVEQTTPRGLRRISNESAGCPGGTHFTSKPVYLHGHQPQTKQIAEGYEKVSYGWG